MPSVDIVIVNWNTGYQLRNCLKTIPVAVDSSCYILNRIVIIDNNSKDDSIFGIESYKLPLQIIKNKINRGYGTACNQGSEGSISDYILFLNPDTLLNADSIRLPVIFLENPSSADVAIVGIKLFGDNGKTARTCSRFPTLPMFLYKILGLNKINSSFFSSYVMEEWDHDCSAVVDHVIGAFYLVRRTVFDTLKGYDERFFVYLEDLDFSLRAHNLGYRIYYLSDANAYHKGGGASEQIKAIRLFYSLQSRLLYAFKHFGIVSFIVIAFCTIFIEPFIRLISNLHHKPKSALFDTVYGYMMLCNWLKQKMLRRFFSRN